MTAQEAWDSASRRKRWQIVNFSNIAPVDAVLVDYDVPWRLLEQEQRDRIFMMWETQDAL